jgi:glycosyltransferase involved in cell wall biosynthesis
VSFLGERSDVPALLRAADVFWLTSAWEGLPNVVLEALACGTPVIARDVGAAREIIEHTHHGFLVAERAPEPFVAHTLELLAAPEWARALSDAGRRRVEQTFSVSAMVRATERLYRAVTRRR